MTISFVLVVWRNFVIHLLSLWREVFFTSIRNVKEVIHFLYKVMARIFTVEGLKKLQTELEERKTKMRQEIAHAIKEAKEQGDLSENAEYTEAKRNQNENESRVAELEAMLKDSVVASKHRSSSIVGIGSALSVKVNGKELHFKIVGSNEVDPSQGKISNESPLGREFMGKKKGDKIEVAAPAGTLKYEIISVE